LVIWGAGEPRGCRRPFKKVQNRGAPAALPAGQQRIYAEVSLLELSAFVRWRRGQASRSQNDGAASTDFEAAWDLLDWDDKSEWVPEDPRSVLACDTMWAPLLADGPPACGSAKAAAAIPSRPPGTTIVPSLFGIAALDVGGPIVEQKAECTSQ